MTKTDFIKARLDLHKIAISAFILAMIGLGVYYLQISKHSLITIIVAITILAFCLAILVRSYSILSNDLKSQE